MDIVPGALSLGTCKLERRDDIIGCGGRVHAARNLAEYGNNLLLSLGSKNIYRWEQQNTHYILHQRHYGGMWRLSGKRGSDDRVRGEFPRLEVITGENWTETESGTEYFIGQGFEEISLWTLLRDIDQHNPFERHACSTEQGSTLLS